MSALRSPAGKLTRYALACGYVDVETVAGFRISMEHGVYRASGNGANRWFRTRAAAESFARRHRVTP